MWPFKEKQYCYYIAFLAPREGNTLEVNNLFTPAVTKSFKVDKGQIEDWKRAIGLRINSINVTILSWHRVEV